MNEGPRHDETAQAPSLPDNEPFSPATIAPTEPELQAAAQRGNVPGYELMDELGRGGMGVVYKARQVALNRVVALKMILSGEHARPEDRARFLAEAETIAAIHHPG